MGERIDINLLINNKTKLPPKRQLILELLALLPQRFGYPDKVLFLDFETGYQACSTWDTSDILVLNKQLLENHILTVYMKPPGGKNSICIGLHEAFGKANITISIPLAEVVINPIALIEEWLENLFRLVWAYAQSVLVVGSELHLELTSETMEKTVQIATNSVTNAFWVILNKELLRGAPIDFVSIEQSDNTVMLRRRNVAAALGL
jgi:hypothetical protein